jgi:gluconokinase
VEYAVQAERQAIDRPRAIVVMGVSGSGKTTLSTRLGGQLGCPVLEGDAFHSVASVAKMKAGHPLTDEDRWPWLDRLGHAIGEAAATNGLAVAACSALKRAYRERLAAASAVPLDFVLLDTARDEIARRMASRSGHYMPPSLLDSQLATLERPGPEERALTLDAACPPDTLSAQVTAWLAVAPASG